MGGDESPAARQAGESAEAVLGSGREQFLHRAGTSNSIDQPQILGAEDE